MSLLLPPPELIPLMPDLLASSTTTSDSIIDSTSNTPKSWTVQERPYLATSSIDISASQMSIGQDFTSMVVQVQDSLVAGLGQCPLGFHPDPGGW